MPFTPSSPVTGGAQTGLTSPTYTLSTDQAPASHGKQYAVTALGGTQTGVEVHSTSNPFTVTCYKVPNPKRLPSVHPVTGVLSNVPKNTFQLVIRKGAEVMSGQPREIAIAKCEFAIPAGADIQDPESVRAMLSLLVGILSGESADMGDLFIQNVLG
jgi:hypothetical protein